MLGSHQKKEKQKEKVEPLHNKMENCWDILMGEKAIVERYIQSENTYGKAPDTQLFLSASM